MPAPKPPEFKRDVVTVARRGDLSVAEVGPGDDDGDVAGASPSPGRRARVVDDGGKRQRKRTPMIAARAWRFGRVGVLVVAAAALAACGSSALDATATSAPSSSPSGSDALAWILARGTVLLPTDPEYPPQSFSVKNAKRASGTKCAANELTGSEVDGYDVAASKLFAEKLGVEPCFVVPTWSQMLSGHWGGRMDIAFASIGITPSRMKELYFTQPYYAMPEKFFVRSGGAFTRVEQLSGQRVGACTDCFADLYLQGTLVVPGTDVEFKVRNATIERYDVERNGLSAVATDKLDAFLCSVIVGEQSIDQGLELTELDPAPYAAYIGGAVDRFSGLDVRSLVARANDIMSTAHADGSLAALSDKYFGSDFATVASDFDLAALNQTMP